MTKELSAMRDELTPKQVSFAEHLVAQENRKTATECAVMAGYAEHSARITASKLQSAKSFLKSMPTLEHYKKTFGINTRSPGYTYA